MIVSRILMICALLLAALPALAQEDCECLIIHEGNLDTLMREFPDLLRGMLTEMARRLRETSETGGRG